MFPPGIQMQMRARAEQLLGGDAANVVTAILHWRTVTRPPGWHPEDESSSSGSTVENGSEEFRALFHQVGPRLSGFQRFMEVESGDVILEYLAELPLAGKEDVRVEVDGDFYVQKTASKELLEAWDVRSSTGGLFKTILLTPAP